MELLFLDMNLSHASRPVEPSLIHTVKLIPEQDYGNVHSVLIVILFPLIIRTFLKMLFHPSYYQQAPLSNIDYQDLLPIRPSSSLSSIHVKRKIV